MGQTELIRMTLPLLDSECLGSVMYLKECYLNEWFSWKRPTGLDRMFVPMWQENGLRKLFFLLIPGACSEPEPYDLRSPPALESQ